MTEGNEIPAQDAVQDNARWSGLKERTLSAGVLVAVLLFALWMGGWLFSLLVMAAGFIMIREWDSLTAQEKAGWKWIGLAYAGIPCASLIWLRGVHFEGGVAVGGKLTLFVMFAVWATDIGAYFAGRKIGGPKLAPSISPKKTWAGLGGGIACAALVCGFSASFTPYPLSFATCAGLGGLLAVIAQAGDLFESWLKRRSGAKDSGTLIPGHGGLLDRVDGLIFTVPFFAWLVCLSGKLA